MKKIRAVLTTLLIGVAAQAAASNGNSVSIPDRVRGSEQVLVASVSDLNATFETNQFGDRVIVSHARLRVEERLKGQTPSTVDVDVLGGTVGGLTLDISSLPGMNRGDRAVFFLDRDARTGRFVPHMQGQGILKLDSQNRVQGSSLDLNTIRALAASAR